MTKYELETIRKALDWANRYFDDYLSLTNAWIYDSDEEIERIQDDDRREIAQENKDYDELLGDAESIINKYINKKGSE